MVGPYATPARDVGPDPVCETGAVLSGGEVIIVLLAALGLIVLAVTAVAGIVTRLVRGQVAERRRRWRRRC